MLLHVKRDLVQRKWQYVEIRPVSHRPSSCTGFGESLTYQFHRLDLRKSATRAISRLPQRLCSEKNSTCGT